MTRALALVMVVAGAAAAAPERPPYGIKAVVIDYTWGGLASHQAAHYELHWNGSAYTTGNRSLGATWIRELVTASAGGHASTRALQCISHTDDYPAFTIKLVGDTTDTISTTSNCLYHAPWNVERGGKMSAQFTSAIWTHMRSILQEVDPDKWKNASDGEGSGSVILDELPGVLAAACASSIEHDVAIQHALGEVVHVDKLTLVCDLVDSPNCTTASADAAFRWRGVDAGLELACTDGKVDATSAIADAKSLRDSKPVTALIKIARTTVRMSNTRGTWRIQASADLPTLYVRAGTTVITARGITTAFWKELGLPAKQLPADKTAALDYAGKVVP